MTDKKIVDAVGKILEESKKSDRKFKQKIDLVINVPMGNKRKSYSDVLTDGYIIRRQAVEFNVPVITNLELAATLVKVLQQKGTDEVTIRSLNEYMDDLPWKLW